MASPRLTQFSHGCDLLHLSLKNLASAPLLRKQRQLFWLSRLVPHQYAELGDLTFYSGTERMTAVLCSSFLPLGTAHRGKIVHCLSLTEGWESSWGCSNLGGMVVAFVDRFEQESQRVAPKRSRY